MALLGGITSNMEVSRPSVIVEMLSPSIFHSKAQERRMIDVHPPHQATHTWTDFAIHIATICVGLLIAIGLEQSVEYIHRGHERRDLREALYAESEQIMRDSRTTRESSDTATLWAGARIVQLKAALRENRPVPPGPPTPPNTGDSPNDPIWQAAKTSNTAALLSRDELTAYGELNFRSGDTRDLFNNVNVAWLAGSAYAVRFGSNMGTADLSHASPEEIREMIEHLGAFALALNLIANSASKTEGAAEAVHNGEHDLAKIYAAERSAEKRDSDAFGPRFSAMALAELKQTRP